MTKKEMKRRVLEAIERRKNDAFALGREIYAHPELGYREERTSQLLADQFRKLGLPCRQGLALTGVKAELIGGSSGPGVAVVADMDAIVVRGHPDADPKTGIVHACGHHAQMASMVLTAWALAESGVAEHLAGKVLFVGAPAEEYLEVAYRNELRSAGKIRFLVGKQELLAGGHLDDVDAAVCIHGRGNSPRPVFQYGMTSNGFIGRLVRFRGVESHAGDPYRGRNSLAAATLGMTAINFIRDTLPDEAYLRIHSMITKGGEVVNTIPGDVRLENTVRASSTEFLVDAATKVNRALGLSAEILRVEAEITQLPGYLPMKPSAALEEIVAANARALLGEDMVRSGGHNATSTDMGDLSQVMPISHPKCGGFEGALHTPALRIVDEDAAYAQPARIIAQTAIDLLSDGAEEARAIVDHFAPPVPRERFVATWDDILSETLRQAGR